VAVEQAHLTYSIPTVQQLPYAHSGPAGTGKLRVEIDDFIVDEVLGFDLSGEGEHVFLQIEKRNCLTESIAQNLAKFVGVRRRDVGFAGLKDKFAKTTQWFSVPVPFDVDLDWSRLNDVTRKVLRVERHRRKLKRGALSGNRFEILLRNLEADLQRIENILNSIRNVGVPNYFGPQRFGRCGQNISGAVALFKSRKSIGDRFKRGMYLSAARSHVFNLILATRVDRQDWNYACCGDAMMLHGSNSYFRIDEPTDEINQRTMAGKIHPTGAMWGIGPSDVTGDMLGLEKRVVSENRLLCDGLESNGVKMARRSLRLMPNSLDWQFIGSDSLKLTFSLQSGGYATSVLRELIDTETIPGE